jgi:glucuronoarabinoxylan endo-1,4-beta-xylanase
MTFVQRIRLMGIVVILTTIAFQPGLDAADCVINGNNRFQMIDGFGFSSAWCGTLSTAKNDALYNTLGMSLLRIRIDPNRSWSQETANSSAAHARGAKVLGSGWTPPANLKDNNNIVGGNLLTSQYGSYATFLRDAANAINLDWVSFQNEPDITVTYESCHWTPTQLLNFTKNNSSAIGRAIVMPESFQFNDAYSDPTLNDSAAAARVTFIGGHIYGGGNYVHSNAISKGKRVWMTEHYLNGQTIDAAVNIAKEVSDCMNNQMSAYFWWWVNDTDNNVNLVNNSGTIFKNAYGIGQFAKWVRPGKQRIGATYQPTSGVYVTAYRNNGLAIVVVNTTNSTIWQTFTLQNLGTVPSMPVHRTTSSLNMASVGNTTMSNNTFGLNLPPKSITTVHQ